MTITLDIINRALELTGENVQISGAIPAFDGSPAGQAAAVLYQPTVEMLLRQLDPEFARTAAVLVAQAGATLLAMTKWTQEYAYPEFCLRLRQVRPAPGSYDALDPVPVRAAVMADKLAGGVVRVVMTNQAGAIAVFTTLAAGLGGEYLWDTSFAETVVRRLASPLAMAIAGRPDFARELLEESEKFAQMAELSEDL